jgi:hypothetical protein
MTAARVDKHGIREVSPEAREKGKSWMRWPAILLLCAALFPVWPGQAAEGPLEALVLAQKGIDARDPDLFHQAVDLDAVLAHGLDEAIDALVGQARSGALDPLLSMTVLSLTDGSPQNRELLTALLASEVRGFVNTGISKGVFAGSGEDKSGFSPLFKGISLDRKEILPGKILSRKDGRATVSATFRDRKAGSFPLRLALEETDSRWRVKKILNGPELIREALRHGR